MVLRDSLGLWALVLMNQCVTSVPWSHSVDNGIYVLFHCTDAL